MPDRLAGFWFREEYLNATMSLFFTNGTGTNSRTASAIGGRPGINVATVTASATPDRASSTMSNSPVYATGGGLMTLEGELKIPTLSNGVDNLTMRFAIAGPSQINGNIDLTGGVYFEYDYGNHANSQNLFLCAATGGVRTKIDTGFAMVANTWTRLKLQLAADSSAVTGFVNGANVGVVNTNVPVANTMLDFGWHVVKQLGAGALNVNFDYLEVIQTFTSSR